MRLSSYFARIFRIARQSLFCAIYAFGAGWSGVSFADGGIEASGQTRTYKYDAPNGVPVVNIATPNGRGLSHNKYNKFNVDQRGAVLNNTSEVLQSQLAGAIRGNPNIIKGREASIILNEVVKPNRSLLNGFIEVNGVMADVVIANPYGITANGVGFINTSRAVLTTGVPTIDPLGDLTGFRVEQGDIRIEGNGINASNQNYLDLVARSLYIDGRINAKNLHITAGPNDWSYVDRTATPVTTSDSKPGYAIDSTAFGGMYADKIKVVATEAGVGVRMRGDMASSAEQLFISSKGTLALKSKISAAKKVELVHNGTAADGKITIEGATASVTAGEDLVIDSSKGVELSEAALKANGGLTINSETLTDNGSSTNTRAADGDINITTSGKTELNGSKWVAADDMTATTGEFKVGANGVELYSGTDAAKSGKSIIINASTGNIELAKGKLESAGDIELTTTAGAISTTSDAAQKVAASNDIRLNAKTNLTNAGNVLAGNDLTVRSTNSAGNLTLNNTGVLQATDSLNLAGYGGNDDLVISNSSSGKLLGKILAITADSLTNTSGASIQGTQGGTVNITNTLSNSGAFILAANDGFSGIFNIGSLNNSGTLKGKDDLYLNISQANSLTNSGSIYAGDLLKVRYTTNTGTLSLTNSGTMEAGSTLDLAGYGGGTTLNITNQSSGKLLGNSLLISANSLSNASSALLRGNSGGTITLAGSLNNNGGELNVTGGLLTLAVSGNVTNKNGGKILVGTTNNSDQMVSAGNLDLSAQNLYNYDTSTIQASRQADLDLSGQLDNDGTLIISADGSTGSKSTVQAASVDNSGTLQGDISTEITLGATGSLNNSSGASKLLITTGSLTIRPDSDSSTTSVSNSGRLEALNGIDIQGYNSGSNINVTVASGGVLKGGNIRIKGSTVNNNGTIQNDSNHGALDIDVATFNNIGSGSLLLNSGNNWSDLNVSGTITNQGAMHSVAAFTIAANSLGNSSTGGISSNDDLSLTVSSDFDNKGALYAGGDLTMTATGKTITNEAGATIDSDGSITSSSATFTNYSDINAANNITINTTVAFNNLFSVTGGTLKDEVITYTPMTRDEMQAYADTGNKEDWVFFDGATGTVWVIDDDDKWAVDSHQDSYDEYTFNSAAYYGDPDDKTKSIWGPIVSDTGRVKVSAAGSGSYGGDPTKSNDDGNWSIFQFDGRYFDDGFWYGYDGGFEYKFARGQTKTTTTNVVSDGATVTKAKIAAGGTLTINMGSGNGTNDGSILSANTINLNGSGNFTNNARASEKTTEYVQYGYRLKVCDSDNHDCGGDDEFQFRTEKTAGSEYRPDGNWTDVASESNAKTYALANTENMGTVSVGGIGAGVFADTLNVNISGTVNNEGSPVGASTTALSHTGASGATAGATTNGSSGGGLSFGSTLSFLGLNLNLPTNPNGFFITNLDPNAQYLVETNKRFGLDANYLGSNYLFKKLNLDDDNTKNIQRLGDAAYENYLIRQQIMSKTGRDVLAKYQFDSKKQTAALLNNAITLIENKEIYLSPGIALSASQVANLTKDIVWPVKKTIIVNDKPREVLVPVVYLAKATLEGLNGAGEAQMVANNMNIKAGELKNTGGVIEGTKQLTVTTEKDISNTAGTIRGGDVSLTSTKGNIDNRTLAQQVGGDMKYETRFSKTATIQSTGKLKLDAKKDVVSVGGKIKSGGNADIKAGGNVAFGNLENRSGSKSTTVTSGNKIKTTGNTDLKVGTPIGQQNVDMTLAARVSSGTITKKHEQSKTTSVGSSLEVGGDLKLDAGKDLVAVGSDLNIKGGADIKTGGDVDIRAANESTSRSDSTKLKVESFLNTTTAEEYSSSSKSTARGSTLKVGKNLKLDAGGDLTSVGSDLDIGGNADLKTGGSINLLSAQEASENKSGTEVSVGMGFLGSVDKESSKFSTKTTAKGSTLKVGGNLKAKAGEDINVVGSEVDVTKSAKLGAKNVTFSAAKETSFSKTKESTDAGLLGSLVGGINKSEEDIKAGTKYSDAKSKLKIGGNLDITTSEDITFASSDVDVTGGADLNAGGDQTFLALSDKTITKKVIKEDKGFSFYAEADAANDKGLVKSEAGANVDRTAHSGYSASAGAGIQREWETKTTTNTKTTAVVSKIKVGGNLTRKAGDTLLDQGTDIEVGGNYTQDAKRIRNLAAKNTDTTTTKTEKLQIRYGVYAEAVAEENFSDNLNQVIDKGKSIYNKANTAATGGDNNAQTGTRIGKGALAAYAAKSIKDDIKNLANSGASGSAEAGFENRSKFTSTTETETNETAVVSKIKVGGKFTSTSKEKTTFEGTDVKAGGDIDITASELDVKAAQNSTKKEIDSSSHETYGRLGASANANAGSGGAKAGGELKVETGYQYTSDKQKSSSTTAVVASFKSGSKFKVKTTKGDASFEGSKITAEKGATVDAAGSVNLKAAKDTQKTDNKSWKAGGYVKVTYDGKPGGGGGAHGEMNKSDSNSSQSRVASIDAGSGGLTITAGKDVTMVGTKARGQGGLKIDAKGGDVKVLAAYDTDNSKELSAQGRVDVSVSKGGGKTKGGVGLQASLSGSKSSSKEANVADLDFGGGIDVTAKKDLTMEGTNLTTKSGSVNIKASEGKVNLKAAKSDSLTYGGGISISGSASKSKSGKGTKKKGSASGEVQFGVDKSHTEKGVNIAGGGNLNIESGGKTTLEGTKARMGGTAKIDAKGGVEKKKAVNYGVSATTSFSASASKEVKKKAPVNKSFNRQNQYKFKKETRMDVVKQKLGSAKNKLNKKLKQIDKKAPDAIATGGKDLDFDYKSQSVDIQGGVEQKDAQKTPKKVEAYFEVLKELFDEGIAPQDAVDELGISSATLKSWFKDYPSMKTKYPELISKEQ